MESLNVLITAASRRVPLVRAFQARAASTSAVRGRVIVTDVNPLSPAVHVADRWYHVPLATAPGLHRRDRRDLRRRGHRPDRADHRRRAGGVRRRRPAGSGRAGIPVAVSPEATSRDLQRQARRPAATCARTASARRDVLPGGRRPAAPRFPLFIKPRFGRGGVGAFPICDRKDLAFFTEYVDDPGRPGIPRRSGVHDRSAVRLRAPAALHRAARARRRPCRRHRSRPHRARPSADRAGRRRRERAAVLRRRQHPVPRRRRAADGVRDQPALLGRHSADDRRRRRFSRGSRRPRARPAGAGRASAGSATTCG